MWLSVNTKLSGEKRDEAKSSCGMTQSGECTNEALVFDPPSGDRDGKEALELFGGEDEI